MSDYRDPLRDPLDPANPGMRADTRANSGLGWIAGAVFLVVVLALIFGLGRTGDQTATSTGGSPPAATTGAAPPSTTGAAPPSSPAPRTAPGSGQ